MAKSVPKAPKAVKAGKSVITGSLVLAVLVVAVLALGTWWVTRPNNAQTKSQRLAATMQYVPAAPEDDTMRARLLREDVLVAELVQAGDISNPQARNIDLHGVLP